MTDREREIIALAFGNLESTIRQLPNQCVRWWPPLTASEVAKLRRKLTGPVLVAALVEHPHG